jgi:N-acetyl-anhydromuramyl-L-alanine amidase AmpD
MSIVKNLGFRESPNHLKGRGKWDNKADVIVMHVTEGAFIGACDWLCNPASQASATFVTSQKGEFRQLVDLKNMAWCNGNSPETIHEATNSIVKARPNDNANLYSFSIENEGWSYKGNYGIPTEAQMEAIYTVCKIIVDYILTYNPTWRASRENIIGHCHIRKIEKPSCPTANYGEKFPFDKIINEINLYIDKKLGVTTPPIEVIIPSTPKPIDTVAAAGMKVGTFVRVRNGAKTYSGGRVASFIYQNKYPISVYSGDRVVLDKDGICTPFNVKDLYIDTIIEKKEFKIGSYVRIKKGAMWNTNPPRAVPEWVRNSVHIIDELKGTRALIDKKGICSPIDIKYLTLE